MLGCFNPIIGQIWTNSNTGLKMSFKKCWVFNPILGQTWTNSNIGLKTSFKM